MQSSSPLLARPGADLAVRLLPLWDGWQAGRPIIGNLAVTVFGEKMIDDESISD
jgi:hypothetical protein